MMWDLVSNLFMAVVAMEWHHPERIFVSVVARMVPLLIFDHLMS